MSQEEGLTADIAIPFDPVARSAAAEDVCMRRDARRYHRFRAARYYGGIVTADAVGCSFLCGFCWNYDRNLDPARHGRFFTPEQVVRRLIGLATRSGYRLFRVTGSEPILGERSLTHLRAVYGGIMRMMPEASFVLETNGLMLGWDERLVDRIPRPHVAIRVALKGVDEASFQRISGARAEFFQYPLRAILALEQRGFQVWPAVMEDLHTREDLQALRRRLSADGVRSRLEIETLERYPAVMGRLRQRGLCG